MKRRNVLTFTGGGGSRLSRNSNLEPSVWTTNLAFTMAEILLSLTIIGVVAAITLPSLTGNINERTWNTQRKALYARFSQAIALMPSLNGYGTLTEDASGSIEDTAAETFVTSGLSKVLKINNICDNEHLQDCGLPEKITNFAGSQLDFPLNIEDLNSINTYLSQSNSSAGIDRYYSMINAKAAAFETQNGESIAVFYNNSCQADMGETSEIFVTKKTCVNFVYDLNGNKGPNTMGKDLGFISVYYPTDSVVVAPIPYPRDAGVSASSGVGNVCKSLDEDYRMPTILELGALNYNLNLVGNMEAGRYASASYLSASSNWYLVPSAGLFNPFLHLAGNADVRCVKR